MRISFGLDENVANPIALVSLVFSGRTPTRSRWITLMAVDFSGSWKLECTEENFDAFLKVCGVSWAWRKAACSVKPAVSISQDEGGHFVIVTKTTYRTQEMRFTVGEEFLSIIPWEAGEHPMMANWDDGKLVITVLGTDISFTREIVGGQSLLLTQTKGELSTRRYFKRAVAES